MNVIVNGESFRTVPMRQEDVKPGTCIRWRESRRAFRIVCLDGNDAILRNLRNPDLLEAVDRELLSDMSYLLLSEQERD